MHTTRALSLTLALSLTGAAAPARAALGKLRDLMVTFTPDFEILPGTAPTGRQVPPGRSFALPASGLIQTD